MSATFTLDNGKKAKVVVISSTGSGASDTVTWELHSDEALTDAEINFLIECERPSPGYGASKSERVNAPGDKGWRVRVTSWASCD